MLGHKFEATLFEAFVKTKFKKHLIEETMDSRFDSQSNMLAAKEPRYFY